MPSERQKLFLEGPIGSALLQLAVPIILGNVLQTGYQLTDAFWVGRLGGPSVAAVAVSFPITFLVIALGAGLAIAGATLSAQYMGAGRQDMVNHVAAQTMLMVAITSVIMGAAGYVLSPYLLELIGVEPDVYHGALGFMRVSFIGIIFVFLYGMFQALMRGVGETRMPLIIVLATVILNFLFDPLFIFGWGWIPGQGVMGAAIATLATQGLAAVLGMTIFLRGRHGIQLGWRDFRPDPQYIKRAFFLGLPGSIELSTRGLGPLLMTFLVTGFGTVTLAAYGIGSNILQFIVIPAMGLSMAVSTLVSQNIGAGNIQRASRVALLGSVSGFIILTAAGLGAYLFAPALVAFFVPRDAAVIGEGANFLRVMCSSIRSRRRFILASVKFLSRALTALNLEPSMATLPSLSRSSSRHSATKARQTSRMALLLSLRKSAMVLKSGASCPVSQISSILRRHSRSSRRLDGTRLR
jgi:putative MATE family efflux protein